MLRICRRLLLLVTIGAIIGLACLSLASNVSADHDKFRFKWPYAPGIGVTTTSLPFNGFHSCTGGSCTNAWDLVIPGADVRASAEGTIISARNTIDPGTCNPNEGLGNFVKLLTSGDPLGNMTVRYAHFASTPYNSPDDNGVRVLQGDHVGTQGQTGFTTNGQGGCGPHLHWQFGEAVAGADRPTYIDGVNVSAPYPNTPLAGPSTNSWVDGLSQPAQAIRGVYIFLGALLNPDNSWEALGWTADLNPPHVGCGSFALCQLFIHYVPNPELGRWGSIMDVKRHPQTLEYENVPGIMFDANAIMVGRWDVNSAYLVQLPFYLSWLLGTEGEQVVPNGTDIGIPMNNQLDSSINATLCPSEFDCEGYQRFSHGYIWEEQNEGVQSAVFCPDVAGPDSIVDLPNDILGTSQAFNPGGYGGLPFEPAADARFDVNGDGVIDLPNDILGVITHFQMQCFPGGNPPQM